MKGHLISILSITIIISLAFPSAVQAASRRTPVVEAVEKSLPAIVNISTERVVQQQFGQSFGYRDRMFDELFQQFNRQFEPVERRTSSLGSGVIIDPAGIIVTNEHVINRATRITVTLTDKRRFAGTLLSSDPTSDLAVIKIEADGPLPYITMGTSSDLMIGETVIAVGNPFGLEGSVSSGVLSATNRSVRASGQLLLENLLQIDAAINPGNSGGALININGELIGINTAIVAQGEGIGFALAVDTVKDLLVNLLDHKVLKRIWLGLQLQPITPELEKQLGITGGGALVSEVEDGSPAAKARLMRDDVITSVDGKPVSHPFEFQRIILNKNVGDRVSLRLRRGRTTHTATLTVQELPRKSGEELAWERLGLQLQAISADVAKALDVNPDIGLIVTEVQPDGPAARAGFRRGDLLLRIGGVPVGSIDALANVLEQVRNGMNMQVLLYRGNALYRGVIRVSFP